VLWKEVVRGDWAKYDNEEPPNLKAYWSPAIICKSYQSKENGKSRYVGPAGEVNKHGNCWSRDVKGIGHMEYLAVDARIIIIKWNLMK
jgi:hypothetical protein